MEERNTHLSRRGVLATSGGLAFTALAGCSGNGGSGDDGNQSNGGSGDDGNPERFVYAFGRSPTDVQFNPFNAANWAQSLQDQLFHQMVRGYADGTIGSEFLEELSVDGRTLTAQLPEGFTWWNGDEVTSEDLFAKWEIQRLQDPEGSFVESNEIVDDYTVEQTYKNQVTPFLIKSNIVESFINTPRWIYNDYLERLQDATSQSERESVTEDLVTMTISAQDLIDEGMGNGLYELVSFNSSESRTELYEDHPYADRTSIEKVTIIPERGSNLQSLISSDELDMQPNTLINQSSRSYFPDHTENIYEYNWFRMQKFTFNWNNEHLANRNVRRAIATAVDFQPVVEAMRQAGTTGQPVSIQSGIRPSIHEQYLGEGWADQLIDYPSSSDTEAATAYMEAAGYSQDGDQWVDPDGNSFTLSILTQNTNNQLQATNVFSDLLADFGIQSEINTADSTDYYQRLQNYNHDMYWIWHVALALWHPISYFSNDFYGVLGGASEAGETGPTGVPYEVEIPGEVGAEEVSGDGQTIRPAQLMDELPSATSSEEVQNKTQSLVQWFNYDLPAIVFVKESGGYWGDTADFTYPDGEEHKLNTDRPGQVAFKNGWIDFQ